MSLTLWPRRAWATDPRSRHPAAGAGNARRPALKNELQASFMCNVDRVLAPLTLQSQCAIMAAWSVATGYFRSNLAFHAQINSREAVATNLFSR